MVSGSASGGDIAARVDPELLVERRQAQLALIGEHSACSTVYQLAL